MTTVYTYKVGQKYVPYFSYLLATSPYVELIREQESMFRERIYIQAIGTNENLEDFFKVCEKNNIEPRLINQEDIGGQNSEKEEDDEETINMVQAADGLVYKKIN